MKEKQTEANCPRVVASKIVFRVIVKKESLTAAFALVDKKITQQAQQALCKQICFGVLRYYYWLENILGQLMKKPLKKKDQDVYCLLLVGLYQLHFMRKPDYAVISETVEAVKTMRKPWASGLVNAILREFQRHQQEMVEQQQQDLQIEYAHPSWYIEKLVQAWPESWKNILLANNEQPPMTLRVNRKKATRLEYLSLLTQQEISATECQFSSQGIVLDKPADIQQLPGFEQGLISVQDQASQMVASLLNLQPGLRVLDACAAPGGKTAHILETQDNLQCLHALDQDQSRLDRITQNMQRLQLDATCFCGDARQPEDWWDGERYDRILLDAPCSASGVIRRHPDIKLLREEEDIAKLVQVQQQILVTLWSLLKSGGHLVYTTCSVFPAENHQLLDWFCQQQSDTKISQSAIDWATSMPIGHQVLPGEHNMDGFYYAVLEKTG